METLREAYQMAKSNGGTPGIDGVTFEAIEESGAEGFLRQIQDELVTNMYRPMRVLKKPVYARGLSPVGMLDRASIWGPRKSCSKTEEPRSANFES
jgi:RNA-directed DNA polymerase